MTGTDREESRALLALYLNDHLAGATAGLELLRRSARANRNSAAGQVLAGIEEEVTEDRRTLLEMMRNLDVPVHRHKIVAGWVVEKVGRLKLNRRLLRRSPLSNLMEWEALRLGVEGKAAGFLVLRELAEHSSYLDAGRLDGLIARARRQVDQLEQLRLHAARYLFPTAV